MKKTYIGLLLLIPLLVLVSAGKKPVTLFMVGDNTMADKEELDVNPERGWGQLFPSFLQGNLVVQNHACNGHSTKSFIDQERWQEVMSRAQKGDIVLLQFGHNDAKQNDSAYHASVESYETNLMFMIQQAQDKQMHVILCTPIAHRYFSKYTGEFIHAHGAYPEAVRRVAKRMDVPLLDLEESTSQWLQNIGDSASRCYFMNVAPGECLKYPDGHVDDTNLRENGALVVGKMAVQQLQTLDLKWMREYLYIQDKTLPIYTTPCGITY